MGGKVSAKKNKKEEEKYIKKNQYNSYTITKTKTSNDGLDSTMKRKEERNSGFEDKIIEIT